MNQFTDNIQSLTAVLSAGGFGREFKIKNSEGRKLYQGIITEHLLGGTDIVLKKPFGLKSVASVTEVRQFGIRRKFGLLWGNNKIGEVTCKFSLGINATIDNGWTIKGLLLGGQKVYDNDGNLIITVSSDLFTKDSENRTCVLTYQLEYERMAILILMMILGYYYVNPVTS